MNGALGFPLVNALAPLPLWLAALALLVALAIDRWAGEPPVRWHPVVWMGNYLGWAGTRVQRVAGQGAPWVHRGRLDSLPDFKAFWHGALYWTGGSAIVLIVSWALQMGLMVLPEHLGPILGGVLAALLLGLLLKPLLAWALLAREVQAVEHALGQSLAAGRERLSWLVSRDVTQLSEAQVRESAIESLAENLNDSVVAPLFWFVLLGLPGAALYRFANTADAMWGYPGRYQGQNWQWAGKWAARVDDGLNWVPARLTAGLLVVAGALGARGAGGAKGAAWCRLRLQARRTPSPNSGWPMAAMALALDVCLHKPGVYALNATGRTPGADDTQRALIHASKVVRSIAALALLTLVLIVIWSAPWD